MSKIIVPKELQEKIIDLYVNKQYGRMKIKRELNLPFGDAVIKRILQENNIHIRNFDEAKVGQYKMEVPEELQQEIIKLYKEGYGLEKIVEILNTSFSFDKVRSILQDNNIPIRNVQQSAQVKIMPDLRKYKVNDNYEILSHNGCWLLGMYSADGYFPNKKGSRNRLSLALSQTDEEILLRIKEELQIEKPLCYYVQELNGKQYPSVSLDFTSSILRKEFEKYIPTKNKTLELKKLPEIPKDFMLDYLRGIWDGDGTFVITYPGDRKNPRFNTGLTSYNKCFLEEISNYLKENYNFPEGHVYKDHNVWSLQYSARKDVLYLGQLFYENNYLSLQRKKDKYLEMRKINQDIISHEP